MEFTSAAALMPYSRPILSIHEGSDSSCPGRGQIGHSRSIAARSPQPAGVNSWRTNSRLSWSSSARPMPSTRSEALARAPNKFLDLRPPQGTSLSLPRRSLPAHFL
jgi:hypothetical protein